jgi:hypothetical protein
MSRLIVEGIDAFLVDTPSRPYYLRVDSILAADDRSLVVVSRLQQVNVDAMKPTSACSESASLHQRVSSQGLNSRPSLTASRQQSMEGHDMSDMDNFQECVEALGHRSHNVERRGHWWWAIAVLSVATMALAASPSWAQVRLFVRFDQLGSCGGATFGNFEGAIEARSVQLLLAQQVTNPSGGARPSGTDDIVGIQVVQPPSECSPQLFLQSLAGGLLTFRASFLQIDGQQLVVPLEIVATEVGITRLEMIGGPGQVIQEQITLGINGTLTVTTRTSQAAPPLSQCWDFLRNRVC